MKRFLVCALVFGLIMLFAGTAAGKYLYREIVTIILNDGTQVNLVLDNDGMPPPAPGAPMRQIDFAKAGFRAAVGNYKKQFQARQQEFDDRYGPWWWRYWGAQGADMPRDPEKRDKFLAQNVNHATGKFLWPRSAGIQEKRYYYLPPSPKVAVGPDGKPQFLFIKFVTDKTEAEGGASGGILHFLAEYGLTPEQERELEQKLQAKIKGAKLMGAVQMDPGTEESSFKIISATLTDKGFTKSIISSGKAPILPGMKVAAAARLDQYGATLLAKTLEKSTSDLSVEFDMSYTAFTPAFQGKITFDWNKYSASVDEYALRYGDWHGGGCDPEHAYTTDEMQTGYDILCDAGVVNVWWTEDIVDERVNMVREAFMKLWTNSFFDKVPEPMPADEGKPGQGGSEADKAKGRYYTVNKFKAKSSEAFKNQTYSIGMELPIKIPYQTVGNINSAWFKQAKQQFPDLFDEINIEDPFFQRRKVIFNLDLDAAEIFDKVINYVTVKVRKRGAAGREFTDSVTFTKDSVTKQGISQTLTFARANAQDPGIYEYLTQWSLRHGRLFPENPQWVKAELEGVTLAPPIIPLRIDVEADLEELKNNDISAVTLKLRYTKFGAIYEDPEPIRISVTEGKPLVGKMIFHDRDQAKYDYKITFHHKQKEPVDLGWTRGREDAYIYCYLPDSLKKKDKGDLY